MEILYNHDKIKQVQIYEGSISNSNYSFAQHVLLIGMILNLIALSLNNEDKNYKLMFLFIERPFWVVYLENWYVSTE